jgi:hypothetical protein
MLKASTIALCLNVVTLLSACASEVGDEDEAAANSEASSGAAEFSGKLTVSTTSTTVGSPIVVTESATNLTSSQVGPIILGIRRLGLQVTAVQKPATGICRIAGSATCNFVELAAQQTQSYQLTLTASTAGTYTIQGWATSSYVPGGASESVTVTVR